VIKAGRHALWVTGRKPVGRGFALRVDAREDTKNWLAVEGRLEVQEGVPVLRAATVALTSPAGGVQHAPRVIGNAGPPAVVFSMPIEGEPVAPDTRFVVQFSSYMDGDSFAERVRLRDSDTGQELSVGWSYDDTRRALIIQPRQALRPGARVELWLLSGITDADENPLASGAEGAPGASDVVQVLRWHVEG
jgi:hypothetical protein